MSSVLTPPQLAIDAPAPALLATPRSPNQRAWARFRRNRLGWWSLWLFAAMLLVSTFAELVSNDRLAPQHELRLRSIPFVAQAAVPVQHKGHALDSMLRLDLLVDDLVVVQIKSIVAIEDVHRAQLLTYLRLAHNETGLLINFNVVSLKRGIRRVVNTLRNSASSSTLR